MATFGKLTTGGQNDEIFGGNKYVSAYTLTTDTADISKLTLDVDGLGSGGAGNVVICGVIYDDIAGAPGNLVGVGDNVTITHTGAGTGQARAQVDLPLSTSGLPPGTYWLGVAHVSGVSQGARYWADFASGLGARNSTGVTDPFGTPTTLDENVAVFATYTVYVPGAYSVLTQKRRPMPMMTGPGRDTIMSLDGVSASGARRTIDAELQQEVRLYYEPAPLVPPDVSITTPTASETITTNPYLVTASVVGTPAPDHLQFEISADGGTTWQRLSAWNPLPPYETNFNTWRYPNGSYKLRASIYQGDAESSLLVTSAVVDFTLNIAAGTVRDYVGGVDTLSAAVAAASDGDTIRLDGTFPDETGTVNVNKRVKIIQKPGGGRAQIATRTRFTADAVYSSEVDYVAVTASNPILETKACVVRGTAANPAVITNSNAGIGYQDASTIPFDPDGAFDTLIENVNIHDCGDRTTQTNAAHGIYAQNSMRLFVRETIFYHNAARQIQLYPQAQQATIYKCALYDSEMAVNFGGDTSSGAGMSDPSPDRQFVTSYCKLERCIIGKGGGDDGSSTDALIYTFWGHGVPPGPGNLVLTCFLHDPPTGGAGAGKYIDTSLGGLRDAGDNVTGLTPGYTNAAAANFVLTAGANAIGYGPDRIQPTPITSLSLTATAVVVTASMLRQTNKPLSATAVAVTASMVRSVRKALTATSVTVSGTMARQVGKLLTATTVVVTASLVKQVNKALTATSVVVTASMQRQVNKTLTATSVVVTATLQALKVIVKTMSATAVAVTATMQRQVNKPLVATTIAATASLQKQVNKNLTATTVAVTATLQALKVILKAMTATAVVVTASMVKQVNKPLVATTIAVTSSIQKQANKRLTATTVAITASLQALKVIVKAMTATAVVVSASISRQVQLHLSATVALSASIAKRISKTLNATVSAGASLLASFAGVLIGPFAASLSVQDVVSNALGIADLSTITATISDSSGADVTVVDSSASASTQDLAGADVTVVDLVP